MFKNLNRLFRGSPIDFAASGWFTFMICISLFSCDHQKDVNRIPSKELTENIKTQTNLDTIKFGFISRYNPRIMYEEYQPIMDYLSESTPYYFELTLGKTYQDAVNHLEKNMVQISSLGAVTYVQARSSFNATPILKPLNESGEAFYRSLIIVRDDSDIKSIADLEGRSFAFASEYSTSGNLLPRYALKKYGFSLDRFSHFVNLKHHDSVTKAILSGKYDAGAVKDIIGQRYLNKGLRVLYTSEPIPSVPLVVNTDLDQQVVEAIKKSLLAINIEDTEYANLVKDWNREFKYGFVEATDEDYAIIKEIISGIPEICNKIKNSDIDSLKPPTRIMP